MLYCRLSFYFPFVSLPAYLIVCLNVIIFVCLSFFYLSVTELLQLTLVFLQTDLYKSSVLSKQKCVEGLMFRIVCIDQPGHGRSSHYPPGMHYKLSDGFTVLRRVLDHLQWEKCCIMGHSLGNTQFENS